MINPATGRLRTYLQDDRLFVMPCCHDALSAKLIEKNGFAMTFMSGFTVSATRLGMPDTGLISFGEMVDQLRSITQSISIPVLADGDTGYGNAVNIKRTVREYAAAGAACVMIEDQVWPKRCGHTQGKQIVSFDEACSRIQAAVDAREEGADILIMARTDARAIDGIDEAIRRMQACADIGADILFLEAPQSIEEMERFCGEVDGVKMANLIENGLTPVLPPGELQRIGFSIAAYPLLLLQSIVTSMEASLQALASGNHPSDLCSFEYVRDVVGFPQYYDEAARYLKT